jgi:DNA-binding beta-propeller fold protein YncE
VIASSDGKTAYITNYTRGNTISYVGVVDLKTLTLAGRIESGPGPDGLAWAVQN